MPVSVASACADQHRLLGGGPTDRHQLPHSVRRRPSDDPTPAHTTASLSRAAAVEIDRPADHWHRVLLLTSSLALRSLPATASRTHAAVVIGRLGEIGKSFSCRQHLSAASVTAASTTRRPVATNLLRTFSSRRHESHFAFAHLTKAAKGGLCIKERNKTF